MGSSLTSQSFAKHECLDFNLSELPYLVSVAKPLAIFKVPWPPEPSFLVPVANPVGLFHPPGFRFGDISFTRVRKLACFPRASFVSV